MAHLFKNKCFFLLLLFTYIFHKMVRKASPNDLHTDVLLCIFDYFPVNEIYEIFSEVIPYLTSLLINSRIRLHRNRLSLRSKYM